MTPEPKPGQPLYTPPAERVTIDEIKQRATQVQDLAVEDTKLVVREVYEQNVTRAALIAVGVVVVAASIAYLLGRRAAQAAMTDLPPY